jgi:hypothetical protein
LSQLLLGYLQIAIYVTFKIKIAPNNMQNNLLKNIVRDFAKSSATTSTIALIGSILGLGLFGVSPAGAVTFGTNLIINGDAEESVGLIPTIGAVSGWTGIGTLTSIPYGTDGFPTSTSPGPANRGNNFFAGGTSNLTNPFQYIDVSAGAGVIDAGNARFNLSGFFGGKTDQDDFAALTMILYSERGAETGRSSLGYFTKEDRGNITRLLETSTSDLIPVGTRRITVQLVMIGSVLPGSYNDGYVDNLSLVLTDINASNPTSVPEPSAIPGVLIGGALVVGAIKKRRQKL